MPNLRQVLLRNWPLKLAALALASIVWVIVASEETTSELVAVQVEITLPPDLVLAKPVPPLRALVTGPARELLKLYSAPPTLRAELPRAAQPPRWRLDVAPANILVPRTASVTIQDVEPRALDISLDRLARRDVPVAPRALVQPDSGFALAGRLVVSPAVVRVTGPRALVSGLDSFPTESIEIRGVTAPFERAVRLDTTRQALLTISPQTVTLSGRVRPR
jgi:hypothetical protein